MSEKAKKRARQAAEKAQRLDAGSPSEEDMEELLGDLSPEQAEMFVQALELALRKRRVMLLGYLATILALVIGMLFAFWIYGNREPGGFVGWAFLIPLLAAGVCLLGFGRLARTLKPKPPK